MSDLELVSSALCIRDRKVLLSQRRHDQSFGGRWEFPGGKVELGESPEQGLIRELDEELGVAVIVDTLWDTLCHVYDNRTICMLVFHCTIPDGQTPVCREVQDVAWVPIPDLDPEWGLPANRYLFDRLQREY